MQDMKLQDMSFSRFKIATLDCYSTGFSFQQASKVHDSGSLLYRRRWRDQRVGYSDNFEKVSLTICYTSCLICHADIFMNDDFTVHTVKHIRPPF